LEAAAVVAEAAVLPRRSFYNQTQAEKL